MHTDLVDEIGPRVDRLRAGGAEFLPYVSLVEAPIGFSLGLGGARPALRRQ